MASPRASEALRFDFSLGEKKVADRHDSRPVGEAPCVVQEEPADAVLEEPGDDATEEPAVAVPQEPAGARAGSVAEARALAADVDEAPPWDPYWEEDEPEPPTERGTSADTALTVAEFYDRVRSGLRAEFPGEVWVTGEIRKVSISKGNRYLELADPQGSAMIDVACWTRDWPLIGAELKSVGLQLEAGLVVRILGRVGVWDGAARLRFSMCDLDVAALLGGIAAARRKLLLALEREGLLEANKRLGPPLVPLRVGLVTSAGSEAYRDFTGQLKRAGYAFSTRLEASLVQGPEAPRQIANAIRRLHDFGPDVIVLVRGGGGRGDLAAFDSEVVARAIATSRHPVWTGIGHTGDRSVADEISQRALVTPSGCGEAVVAAVASYLEGVDDAAQAIARRGRIALDRAGERVLDSKGRLARAARHELAEASSAVVLARSRAVHGAVVSLERNLAAVDRQAQDLVRCARHSLQAEEQRLANARSVLAVFDPRRQLARGWSLTKTPDGRVLRSIGDVAVGDTLVTVLADGSVSSQAQTVEPLAETPVPETPTPERRAPA